MKNIVCYLLLLISGTAMCQEKVIPLDANRTYKKEKAMSYMLWEVKSISEFIDRFNYEKFVNDEPFNDSLKQVYPRESYLINLFNEEDERLLKKNYPAPYYTNVRHFIDLICINQTQIDRLSLQEASLSLQGVYQNKAILITVNLQKYYDVNTQTFAWFITNIQLPNDIREKITGNQESKTDSLEVPPKGLFPNAADVAFLPLLQQLNEEGNVRALLLPALAFSLEARWLEKALKKKLLHCNTTSNIKVLLSVGTYYQIELQDFTREKENSGWLITNILTHK